VATEFPLEAGLGRAPADPDGEKIEETARRPIAGVGDHRRHDKRTVQRDRGRGLDHRRQVAPLVAHSDTLQVNFDLRMRISPNPL
jgi:hypothetical protein